MKLYNTPCELDSRSESRFIGPLLPFVGGLLVGGLYTSGRRPYYPYPAYPVYPSYPSYPAYPTYPKYPVPYPPYTPYPGENINIYYPQINTSPVMYPYSTTSTMPISPYGSKETMAYSEEMSFSETKVPYPY